jgi:hypothetical protein
MTTLGITPILVSMLSMALPTASVSALQRTNGPIRQSEDGDKVAASRVADKFLNGIKHFDLPEGKALLRETQWVVGAADYGENFYTKPVFTEVTTLYEGLFPTDIPEVQGYKRLCQMKATSKAGTPLEIRYLMVEYRDKNSQAWKVFTASTGGLDVDSEVSFAKSRLTQAQQTSAQENYGTYAFWLIHQGKIKAASDVLRIALESNPKPEDPASAKVWAASGGEEHTKQMILAQIEVLSHIF